MNKVIPIGFLSDSGRTDHSVLVWPNVVSAIPLFIGFFPALLLVIFRRKFRRLLFWIYPAGEQNLGEIEEHLDNYFDALPIEGRRWMIAEETMCREELKFRIITNVNLEKLKKRN